MSLRQQIRARLAAIGHYPTPWTARRDSDTWQVTAQVKASHDVVLAVTEDPGMAELIAHAATDLVYLLLVVEDQAEMIRRLKEREAWG